MLLIGKWYQGGSSGNPLEAAQEREQYNLAIREVSHLSSQNSIPYVVVRLNLEKRKRQEGDK